MAKKPAPSRAPQRPQPKSSARPARPERAKEAARASWWPFVLIALVVTALCYWPSLRNDFVNWDDQVNITENPNLEMVGKGVPWSQITGNIFSLEKGAVIGNYNPLPIFTFAVEKSLSGGENNPRLVHFNNLLLHLLTVFFAMRLLMQLGIGRWGTLAGGLLFGIHPMRVESVAWATERKDVLFAAFFFAALVCYVRWTKTDEAGRRTRQYALMLVLAVLALLSKVQAVTLPLSMVAIDLWLRRPFNVRTVLVEKLPFWILSLVTGLVNVYTLRLQGSVGGDGDVTDFNLFDRLCIGAYSYLVYLLKLIVPHPMVPVYPYPKILPWEVYAALLPGLGFIALIVWLVMRKTHSIWTFGWLFFTFNVMFMLQIVGAGQGFLADRFTYVPYFGFFAIAAFYFDRYVGREQWRTALIAGLAVLSGVYAVWTVRQVGIWKNGDTLWSHVMKHGKDNTSLPYWNRGQYWRTEGDYNRSLEDYTKAINIEPTNPELYNSRGKTYFDMAMSGKFKAQAADFLQKALTDYNNALQQPNIKKKAQAEVLINRGAAHGANNNYPQALEDLNKGAGLDPKNKNAYLNRSLVNLNLGRYDEAIADYTEYLKYDPLDPDIYYERGMLRRSTNRSAEAISDLNQAIKLKPDLGLAYLERARAYVLSGNAAAARDDYARAQLYKVQLSQQDMQFLNGR